MKKKPHKDTGHELQLMFTFHIKKIDLRHCGVVVCARRVGLSISETVDPSGFSHTTVSRGLSRGIQSYLQKASLGAGFYSTHAES